MSLTDAAPSVALKDVKWRIDSKPKNERARYVPHMDARIAARLMDEWVGPGNWSDEYRTVTISGKEALLCTVSVWNGERWISKQDVGVASMTEAQKGAVSDAFKRCIAVKWGAGRNVYELPTLWAPCKVIERAGKDPLCYPNDLTIPDLLRQLKARGFDADGTSVDDAHESAEAGSEQTLGRVSGPEPVSASRSTETGIPRDTNRGASAEVSELTALPVSVPMSAGAEDQGKSRTEASPVPSAAPHVPVPPSGATAVAVQAPTPAQESELSTDNEWTVSPSKLAALKASVSAFNAEGASVSMWRAAANLPPLSPKLKPYEVQNWEALLDDILAFSKVSA